MSYQPRERRRQPGEAQGWVGHGDRDSGYNETLTFFTGTSTRFPFSVYGISPT